jgi:putative transcriptional regulator
VISFNPLFEYMNEHNLSFYYLVTKGIDKHTAMRIKNNDNISLRTLNKICKILNCSVDKVIVYIKDE